MPLGSGRPDGWGLLTGINGGFFTLNTAGRNQSFVITPNRRHDPSLHDIANEKQRYLTGVRALFLIKEDIISRFQTVWIDTPRLMFSQDSDFSENADPIYSGYWPQIFRSFLDSKLPQVISSGHKLMLLQGGGALLPVSSVTYTHNPNPDAFSKRPRTALGIAGGDSSCLICVTVKRSTSSDLASVMRSLGAESALAFDGGGSSQMVIKEGMEYVIKDTNEGINGRPVRSALMAYGYPLSSHTINKYIYVRIMSSNFPNPSYPNILAIALVDIHLLIY